MLQLAEHSFCLRIKNILMIYMLSANTIDNTHTHEADINYNHVNYIIRLLNFRYVSNPNIDNSFFNQQFIHLTMQLFSDTVFKAINCLIKELFFIKRKYSKTERPQISNSTEKFIASQTYFANGIIKSFVRNISMNKKYYTIRNKVLFELFRTKYLNLFKLFFGRHIIISVKILEFSVSIFYHNENDENDIKHRIGLFLTLFYTTISKEFWIDYKKLFDDFNNFELSHITNIDTDMPNLQNQHMFSTYKLNESTSSVKPTVEEVFLLISRKLENITDKLKENSEKLDEIVNRICEKATLKRQQSLILFRTYSLHDWSIENVICLELYDICQTIINKLFDTDLSWNFDIIFEELYEFTTSLMVLQMLHDFKNTYTSKILYLNLIIDKIKERYSIIQNEINRDDSKKIKFTEKNLKTYFCENMVFECDLEEILCVVQKLKLITSKFVKIIKQKLSEGICRLNYIQKKTKFDVCLFFSNLSIFNKNIFDTFTDRLILVDNIVSVQCDFYVYYLKIFNKYVVAHEGTQEENTYLFNNLLNDMKNFIEVSTVIFKMKQADKILEYMKNLRKRISTMKQDVIKDAAFFSIIENDINAYLNDNYAQLDMIKANYLLSNEQLTMNFLSNSFGL